MNYNIDNLTTPFDLVMFPSMGLFYENKKSYALVKYLSGIEEDILTAPNLSEHVMAMDMVLKSVILDTDIDIDKLMVGDKNAIILFLRMTAFGPQYDVQIICQNCQKSGKTSFNITEMTAKDIVVHPDENGLFAYKLPKMKIQGNPVELKFRPMTYLDEKNILENDKIHQYYNKGISIYNTLRYNNQIVSINGITDKEAINMIVKKISIKDSQSLRNYMDKVEPGINNSVSLRCSHCNHVMKEEFQINNKFIGLTPEYKNVIWEESFLLGYYGQGQINRDQTFTIATAERKWRIQRIEEELQKKQEAEKRANESAQRGSSR